MSRIHRETIQCPQCGKEVEVTLWDSLNGDLDPKAKQELLDGSLFNFVCPECGYETRMDYGVLYHDMTHNVMVYYVAEEAVAEAKSIFDSMEDVTGIKMPGYRRRIVTNQNALREKAIIFENELDDRVIELIKCIYLAHASKQYPDANIEAVFFFIADGKNILQFIGDAPISAEFDSSMYDTIATNFADILTEETDKEVRIDLDWARQAFRKED